MSATDVKLDRYENAHWKAGARSDSVTIANPEARMAKDWKRPSTIRAPTGRDSVTWRPIFSTMKETHSIVLEKVSVNILQGFGLGNNVLIHEDADTNDKEPCHMWREEVKETSVQNKLKLLLRNDCCTGEGQNRTGAGGQARNGEFDVREIRLAQT